jgi:acyl carrier protein
MSHDDVLERVQKIIADKLGVARPDVTLAANFVDDLNADSLDIVELVWAMEREFDIDIPDHEADRIRTVHDAVSYVTAHMA